MSIPKLITEHGRCYGIELDVLSPVALLLPVQDLVDLSDNEIAERIREYSYRATNVLVKDILEWTSSYWTIHCPVAGLIGYKDLLEKLSPHNQNVIPTTIFLDLLIDIDKFRSWETEGLIDQLGNKKRKKEGYVYLAHSDTGHYKIGYSVGPENRIKVFDTIMPVSVSMVHTFKTDDMPSAERVLHFLFDDFRHQGEWFNLSQDHVEIIKYISGYFNNEIVWGDYHE